MESPLIHRKAIAVAATLLSIPTTLLGQASTATPTSEWPAWVQAVGSILAILVAIAIPMHQRGVEHREAKRAAALRARVTASGLREWLTGAVEVVETHLVELTAPRALGNESYSEHRSALLSLYIPSDAQLFELAPELPDCAERLTRARTLLWQVLRRMEQQSTTESGAKRMEEELGLAASLMKRSLAELANHFPMDGRG